MCSKSYISNMSMTFLLKMSFLPVICHRWLAVYRFLTSVGSFRLAPISFFKIHQILSKPQVMIGQKPNSLYLMGGCTPDSLLQRFTTVLCPSQIILDPPLMSAYYCAGLKIVILRTAVLIRKQIQQEQRQAGGDRLLIMPMNHCKVYFYKGKQFFKCQQVTFA